MNPRPYLYLSGCIFGVVGVGHFLRVALQIPVHVGTWEFPIWVSWFGGPAALALCLWAFILARK